MSKGMSLIQYTAEYATQGDVFSGLDQAMQGFTAILPSYNTLLSTLASTVSTMSFPSFEKFDQFINANVPQSLLSDKHNMARIDRFIKSQSNIFKKKTDITPVHNPYLKLAYLSRYRRRRPTTYKRKFYKRKWPATTARRNTTRRNASFVRRGR